jgi:response regulator of citrate/malate metabolism
MTQSPREADVAQLQDVLTAFEESSGRHTAVPSAAELGAVRWKTIKRLLAILPTETTIRADIQHGLCPVCLRQWKEGGDDLAEGGESLAHHLHRFHSKKGGQS